MAVMTCRADLTGYQIIKHLFRVFFEPLTADRTSYLWFHSVRSSGSYLVIWRSPRRPGQPHAQSLDVVSRARILSNLVFAVFDHPSRGPLLPPFDSNPLVFFRGYDCPFVNTCIFGGMYWCLFHGSSFIILFSLHIVPMFIFLTCRMRLLLLDPSSVSSVFMLLNPISVCLSTRFHLVVRYGDSY